MPNAEFLYELFAPVEFNQVLARVLGDCFRLNGTVSGKRFNEFTQSQAFLICAEDTFLVSGEITVENDSETFPLIDGDFVPVPFIHDPEDQCRINIHGEGAPGAFGGFEGADHTIHIDGGSVHEGGKLRLLQNLKDAVFHLLFIIVDDRLRLLWFRSAFHDARSIHHQRIGSMDRPCANLH